MRDRGTDRSLTPRLDLAVRVDLRLDRDLVGLGLAVRVDTRPANLRLADLRLADLRLADLRRVDTRPADLRLADLRRADPHLASPANPHLARLPDLLLMRPAGLVVLRRVVRNLISLPDPVGLVDRGNLAVPELISLVDPVDPVDRAGPVDLADLVGRARLGLMDPAVPLDPLDPRRSHIGPEVSTIAVAHNSVAPPTRRTASVHPTMVRRLLLRSTGSGGMTGLLPEVLRPTGPGRRLRVAGTDLRLPVAGTDRGTDRRARLLWRRPILGHSVTVASTPFRSSTRSSVDGVSGFSARGSRCTDITRTLAASGLCTRASGGSVVSMHAVVARHRRGA